MNRRGFLKFALVAGAATAVPVLLEDPTPIIYGDGINDDTEGLQAALDGKPFVARDGCVTVQDGRLFIEGGAYRVTRTLHIHSSNVTIRYCFFDCKDLTDDVVMQVHSGTAFTYNMISNTSISVPV